MSAEEKDGDVSPRSYYISSIYMVAKKMDKISYKTMNYISTHLWEQIPKEVHKTEQKIHEGHFFSRN